MKIEHISLRQVRMPMVSEFTTSFGSFLEKDFIILTAYGDGEAGYGESAALPYPFYNEETTETVWYMLKEFLIPSLFKADIQSPDQVADILAHVRRNNMAKAVLEGAIWDLYSKQQGKPLAELLGGTRKEIEVGVSIGIQKSTPELLRKVEQYLEEGYKKIKVKIKPGVDIDAISAIRKEFGDGIPLMADANSAYTLQDIDTLRALDEFNLLMIEQPLEHDDIIDHAKLQSVLNTPVCLDESIHSAEDARKAIELNSCKIINIKIGRVGGLTEAKNIHDLCRQHGIPVWCGGMLEAGVGRAHNIALASMDNFTIPGDTSASSRYWAEDLVEPEIALSAPGIITVPDHPGIGFRLREDIISKHLVREEKVSMSPICRG